MSDEDLKRMTGPCLPEDYIRTNVNGLVKEPFGKDATQQADMMLTIEGITKLLRAAEVSLLLRRKGKKATKG